MDTSIAYLITNPDDTTKTKIQILGGQWSLSAKGYFLTREQKERLDNNDVPEPTLPGGIFIDDDKIEWSVSGNTFNVRDKIKMLGGRWKPSTKSWSVPITKTKEEIIAALTQA